VTGGINRGRTDKVTPDKFRWEKKFSKQKTEVSSSVGERKKKKKGAGKKKTSKIELGRKEVRRAITQGRSQIKKKPQGAEGKKNTSMTHKKGTKRNKGGVKRRVNVRSLSGKTRLIRPSKPNTEKER